jgi:DNA (cytosine-5)-methyltransferase 1
MMRTLELFSGAGGLAKGLELAGFEHAGFVEFNKHACLSLGFLRRYPRL